MFLFFLGGFGRRNLNIIVKWLSKKGIKDQYPGIIYDHVSIPFGFRIQGLFAFVSTTNVSVELTDVCFVFLYYIVVTVNLSLCPASVRCCVCLLRGFWQIGKTGQNIIGNNCHSSLVDQANNRIHQMNKQCLQIVHFSSSVNWQT